jgi:hypothetical protein
MQTSRVTSDRFYKDLPSWTQMNYHYSVVKHEPHGEAIPSLHGIVYPLLGSSKSVRLVPSQMVLTKKGQGRGKRELLQNVL